MLDLYRAIQTAFLHQIYTNYMCNAFQEQIESNKKPETIPQSAELRPSVIDKGLAN